MRTTLDIDEDILSAAKELAKAEGRTMGEVISDLARRALTQPGSGAPGFSEAQADFEDDLFPRFPKRGGPPVTNALIRRIQDEIDMEDSVPFDFETGKPRVFPENS